MSKFLVVDDEPMIAESLCEFLEYEGFAAHRATSGIAALDTFAREGDFDALITDLDMPDMSGLTLVRHCRRLRPDLPVVIITGYAAKAFMEPAGPCTILEKPFHPRQLAEAATRLVGAGR